MTTPSLTNPNPKREGETLTAEQRDEAARLVFFNAWPGLDMKDWNKAGNGRGEAEWQRERAFSIVDMISARLACLGLDALASARPSPGDPVRAALEGALQPLFDDAKHDLEQATHAGDGGGIRYAVIRKIALEQAMEALRAALSVSTPTGEGEAIQRAFKSGAVWAHENPIHADMPRQRQMKAEAYAKTLANPQQGGERDGAPVWGTAALLQAASIDLRWAEDGYSVVLRCKGLDETKKLHDGLRVFAESAPSTSKSSGEEA